MKGVHSAKTLAYKGVILKSVVDGGINRGLVSAYSCILNTNPRNLKHAHERRLSAILEGTSLWTLLT